MTQKEDNSMERKPICLDKEKFCTGTISFPVLYPQSQTLFKTAENTNYGIIPVVNTPAVNWDFYRNRLERLDRALKYVYNNYSKIENKADMKTIIKDSADFYDYLTNKLNNHDVSITKYDTALDKHIMMAESVTKCIKRLKGRKRESFMEFVKTWPIFFTLFITFSVNSEPIPLLIMIFMFFILALVFLLTE